MADVGIKELLEAGVHFGHQTRRWNPSMRRYIHGERDGIHIIELLPTKERMGMQAELAKLDYNLGGVRDMERLPEAVFVIDLKTEAIAVREAARLRIPLIGLVDTNCDPDPVDFVIPGNDDAIRSCKLVVQGISDVVSERSARFRAEEEAARREREEAERREAEERALREQEERERQEAEERARGEAEEAGFAPDEPATPSGTRAEAAAGAAAPRERRTFDPDDES